MKKDPTTGKGLFMPGIFPVDGVFEGKHPFPAVSNKHPMHLAVPCTFTGEPKGCSSQHPCTGSALSSIPPTQCVYGKTSVYSNKLYCILTIKSTPLNPRPLQLQYSMTASIAVHSWQTWGIVTKSPFPGFTTMAWQMLIFQQVTILKPTGTSQHAMLGLMCAFI